MDFTKIDKNMKVETKIEREGLTFYDIDNEPFRIHGVYREGDRYVRMPREFAEGINDSIKWLNGHTTGGRIRFVTDSPYIAMKLVVSGTSKFSFFSITGLLGCDVYSGKQYFGTIIPPLDTENEYENVINIPNPQEREYTINMPIYSCVHKVYIGIKEGSTLKPAGDYKNTKPIVFYGSSVTQGGCASRPGNTYPSIISRELDSDFLSFGFAGSAKGEEEIARHIAGREMSAFCYDYDYNADNLEHYKATHEKFFKIIRAAHPDIPIIMTTRPKKHLAPGEQERIDVMMTTYNNAVAAGDKNVYYIKGTDLLDDSIAEYALIENCHPNDCGFASMAQVLGEKLKEVLTL
ncbi:MAG: hypothetical protein IKU82_05070 [Clostridia bacterium]|nr:hypothetical protein [Clostridia bacterium]